MELLLGIGVDLKGKDARGRTPLHFAVREGDLELVRELLSNGVEVNEKDIEGSSPLHYAVKYRSKCKEEFGIIIEPVNNSAQLKVTTVVRPMECDNDNVLDLIRELLQCGADVTVMDDEGITPLHYAVKIGRGVDVVRELLKNGASVHAKDYIESSPLHYIMKYNCDVDLLRELLKYGADVTAMDYEGMTPLHYALKNGRNVDIVRELLVNGASVNARDKFDSSPLHYFMEYHCDIEVLRELLKHGADVKVVDCDEMTPLHYALMKKRDVEVVRELLTNGASVNAMDNLGSSPLHYIIDCNCDIGVLLELLKHGADVEASDPGGNPPLHIALLSGRYFKKNRIINIIKALLDFGANIQSQGQTGTLFQLALDISPTWASKLVELSVFSYFVRNKIEELCQYINSLKLHCLIVHMNRCIEEVDKTKCYKICGEFSLSRFIMKNGRTVKPIYNSDNHFDIANEISLNFPIYKDDILLIINPCVWRGSLLNDLKDIQLCTKLGASSNNVLNHDCMCLISQYLTNEELNNFITAFKSCED